MLTRSNAGSIYRSDSQDNGQIWSPAYNRGQNNNSGIDLVELDDSSLILPTILLKIGRRGPLEASGMDNARTWKEIFVPRG